MGRETARRSRVPNSVPGGESARGIMARGGVGGLSLSPLFLHFSQPLRNKPHCVTPSSSLSLSLLTVCLCQSHFVSSRLVCRARAGLRRLKVIDSRLPASFHPRFHRLPKISSSLRTNYVCVRVCVCICKFNRNLRRPFSRRVFPANFFPSVIHLTIIKYVISERDGCFCTPGG